MKSGDSSYTVPESGAKWMRKAIGEDAIKAAQTATPAEARKISPIASGRGSGISPYTGRCRYLFA